LAGFIEADGNFYCGYYLNSVGMAHIVKNYMRLSQKRLYKLSTYIPEENNTVCLPPPPSSILEEGGNTNLNIMEKIRLFLQVKRVTYIKRTNNKFIELSYEVRTTKKESCDILINYLSVYPLFSSKHQDFLD
jgi:hypothetical protein